MRFKGNRVSEMHSRMWNFRCTIAEYLLVIVHFIVPSGNNLRYFLSHKFLLHATANPLDFQLEKYVVNHRLVCGHQIVADDVLDSVSCPTCLRRVKVLSVWSSKL